MAIKTCTGTTSQPFVHVQARLSQAATITATGLDAPLVTDATGVVGGTYSISLWAASDLTPTGTYYTVTEFLGSTDNTFNVQVPATAGPFAMSSILVGTPTASPSPNHVSTLIVDGTSGVAINAAGDVAGRSFTASASGPYTPTAAAGQVVAETLQIATTAAFTAGPVTVGGIGVALQNAVPTLEELETRALLATSIAATTTVYLGASNVVQRVGALTLSFSAAITASDTDFWSIALQRIRSNGTALTLVTQTTKVTGGVAIAANTAWTFDNAIWPSIGRYLYKGDILRLVFTKTGAPVALADGCATIRYEPDVRPLVYDSFTRNDASTLGNAESGQAWAALPSGVTQAVFGIRTNQLSLITQGTAARNFVGVDAGVADCSVSFTITATGADTNKARICLRMASSGTEANGYLNDLGNFYRDANGALTSILVFTAAYVVGDTITCVMSGSFFTFYKNGVLNGTISDATYTSTVHGVSTGSPTVTAPLIDDFGIAV